MADSYSAEYPPPDYCDPVIEVYKQDIDRALLRENLRLSVSERLARYEAFLKSLDAIRGLAGVPPRAGGEKS